MTRLYGNAFAESGQREPIPDTSTNEVNYDTGFTSQYDQAFTESGAKTPTQNNINEIFYQITDSIKAYQRTGIPDYIIGVTYNHGNMVRFNNTLYFCNTNNTTNRPPASGWIEFRGGSLSNLGNGHDELPLIGNKSQLNSTNSQYVAVVTWQDTRRINSETHCRFRVYSDGLIEHGFRVEHYYDQNGGQLQTRTINFVVPYTDVNSITVSGIYGGTPRLDTNLSVPVQSISNITATSFVFDYGQVNTNGTPYTLPGHIISTGGFVRVWTRGY